MRQPARLEVLHLSKRYPGCLACDDVSLSVEAGEIHGVLGENGAGKSTLMKCLYGAESADTGEILLDGRQVSIASPADARRLGIGMVFQNFSLFEPLTVADNVALYLRTSSAAAARLTRATAANLGFDLDPDRTVGSLGIGQRQQVEIVRCLIREPRLLILDEPTAVLTPAETAALFDLLERLAATGCAILFISHKLAEVRRLCRRATVLRRGRVAGQCDPGAGSGADLAALIVGEPVDTERQYARARGGPPVLRLEGVDTRAAPGEGVALHNVDLAVGSGEILGIAGVAGSGQEPLNRLINGELLPPRGRVFLGGHDATTWPTAARHRAGLQILPAERHQRGAVATLSLWENVMLTQSERFTGRAGLLQGHRVRRATQTLLGTFDVRGGGVDAPAASLSGGNLQKLLLARALSARPAVLVCNHPTWGVDVKAAAVLQRHIIEARDAGCAVLLITEDLDELFLLADRIAALCGGRLSPALPRSQVSAAQLGLWMTGAMS